MNGNNCDCYSLYAYRHLRGKYQIYSVHLLAVWVWFFAHFSSRGSKPWKYDRARGGEITREYLHVLGESSTEGRYRSCARSPKALGSERDGCVEAVKATLPSIRAINHIQRGNQRRLPHPDPTKNPSESEVGKPHTTMKPRPGCCTWRRTTVLDWEHKRREFFLGSLFGGSALRQLHFQRRRIASENWAGERRSLRRSFHPADLLHPHPRSAVIDWRHPVTWASFSRRVWGEWTVHSYIYIYMWPWSTKPVLRVNFVQLRFMHHLKAEYIILPLMYGLDNIWKSGIWGCKKSKYWENHL